MPITVIRAVYGTTNASVDVTQLCQNMAVYGNDITVNNTALAGDPDPGVVKSFAIVYQLPMATNPGCYMTMTAIEGQTINLVP